MAIINTIRNIITPSSGGVGGGGGGGRGTTPSEPIPSEPSPMFRKKPEMQPSFNVGYYWKKPEDNLGGFTGQGGAGAVGAAYPKSDFVSGGGGGRTDSGSGGGNNNNAPFVSDGGGGNQNNNNNTSNQPTVVDLTMGKANYPSQPTFIQNPDALNQQRSKMTELQLFNENRTILLENKNIILNKYKNGELTNLTKGQIITLNKLLVGETLNRVDETNFSKTVSNEIKNQQNQVTTVDLSKPVTYSPQQTNVIPQQTTARFFNAGGTVNQETAPQSYPQMGLFTAPFVIQRLNEGANKQTLRQTYQELGGKGFSLQVPTRYGMVETPSVGTVAKSAIGNIDTFGMFVAERVATAPTRNAERNQQAIQSDNTIWRAVNTPGGATLGFGFNTRERIDIVPAQDFRQMQSGTIISNEPPKITPSKSYNINPSTLGEDTLLFASKKVTSVIPKKQSEEINTIFNRNIAVQPLYWSESVNVNVPKILEVGSQVAGSQLTGLIFAPGFGLTASAVKNTKTGAKSIALGTQGTTTNLAENTIWVGARPVKKMNIEFQKEMVGSEGLVFIKEINVPRQYRQASTPTLDYFGMSERKTYYRPQTIKVNSIEPIKVTDEGMIPPTTAISATNKNTGKTYVSQITGAIRDETLQSTKPSNTINIFNNEAKVNTRKQNLAEQRQRELLFKEAGNIIKSNKELAGLKIGDQQDLFSANIRGKEYARYKMYRDSSGKIRVKPYDIPLGKSETQSTVLGIKQKVEGFKFYPNEPNVFGFGKEEAPFGHSDAYGFYSPSEGKTYVADRIQGTKVGKIVERHEKGHAFMGVYNKELENLYQGVKRKLDYNELLYRAEKHMTKKYGNNIPYPTDKYISEYLADLYTGKNPPTGTIKFNDANEIYPFVTVSRDTTMPTGKTKLQKTKGLVVVPNNLPGGEQEFASTIFGMSPVQKTKPSPLLSALSSDIAIVAARPAISDIKPVGLNKVKIAPETVKNIAQSTIAQSKYYGTGMYERTDEGMAYQQQKNRQQEFSGFLFRTTPVQGYDVQQNNKERAILKPASLYREKPVLGEATITNTTQKEKEQVIQSPVQTIIPKLREKQKQNTKQRENNIFEFSTTPEVSEPTPPPKNPKKFLFPNDDESNFGSALGFIPQAKVRGTFVTLSKPVSRQKALSIGSRFADVTLARTFRITPTRAKVKRERTEPLVNLSKFRTFRQVKGQRVPMQNTFIEKSRFALEPSEVSIIKPLARRGRIQKSRGVGRAFGI